MKDDPKDILPIGVKQKTRVEEKNDLHRSEVVSRIISQMANSREPNFKVLLKKPEIQDVLMKQLALSPPELAALESFVLFPFLISVLDLRASHEDSEKAKPIPWSHVLNSSTYNKQ